MTFYGVYICPLIVMFRELIYASKNGPVESHLIVLCTKVNSINVMVLLLQLYIITFFCYNKVTCLSGLSHYKCCLCTFYNLTNSNLDKNFNLTLTKVHLETKELYCMASCHQNEEGGGRKSVTN